VGPLAVRCAAPSGYFACFRNVGSQPLITLRFDVPLGSGSLSRANVSVGSGPFGNVATRRIRVDPVDRLLVIALDRALAPSTTYVVRVADSGADGNRLASIDGAPMVGGALIALQTAASFVVSDPPIADPDPIPADPCAAARVLTACGSSGCHGEAPALGLALNRYASVRATAIGQPAQEVVRESTPGANIGGLSDFPRGLARVRPFDANGSYLLWKLLAAPPTTGASCTGPTGDGAPLGDVADPAAATADVIGGLVPGAGAPHVVPSIDDLRALRRWIDQGAVDWGDACAADAGTCAADAGAGPD
jgi:hypothetical protein